jgi:hypothetical protein
MADLIIKPQDIGQIWTWFFRTFQFFFGKMPKGRPKRKPWLRHPRLIISQKTCACYLEPIIATSNKKKCYRWMKKNPMLRVFKCSVLRGFSMLLSLFVLRKIQTNKYKKCTNAFVSASTTKTTGKQKV